jgi:NodT family efflux transporter outer membrane factor (OMF) lipoprotein
MSNVIPWDRRRTIAQSAKAPRRAAPHRACLVAVATALSSVVGACAPTLGPMATLKPAADYEAAKSFQAPAADWPRDQWWKTYADPQLDALIDEALNHSPDLKAAQARVRMAQAQLEVTGAAALPSVSGDAAIQTVKSSINEGFPDEFKPLLPFGYHTQTKIAASLDYQLDFFGRNRAALAAATSAAQAARADEAAARLQLSTAVASAYADLLRLYADRDAAVNAIQVRQNTLDLIRQRYRNGLDTQGTVSQQAEFVPTAKGDLVVIDRQISATRNQIAALLGAGPDRGLEIARPVAPLLRDFGLPPNLKVDLIGRRPDIVAARLRAEAAAKRIKVARADFYPNIDLEASYGVQSLGLNDLLEKGSIVGALGPAVHLPIFSGGQLEGAYRGARAEYDAAVAAYDQSLTNALRDVADVVVSQRALQNQLVDARASLASSEDAYRIATLRYKGGLSPYLNVLTAENALLASRRSLADLQAQSLSLDVALVRALGGGFADDTHLAARSSRAAL